MCETVLADVAKGLLLFRRDKIHFAKGADVSRAVASLRQTAPRLRAIVYLQRLFPDFFSYAAALSPWSRPAGFIPLFNSTSCDPENILNSNVTGLARSGGKAAKESETAPLLDRVLVKVNCCFVVCFFFPFTMANFPGRCVFLPPCDFTRFSTATFTLYGSVLPHLTYILQLPPVHVASISCKCSQEK